MISRKIYLFILLLFINITFVEAKTDKCEYTDKINTCLKNQTNPLAITEFICIKSNNIGEIAFQIILDDKFKQIDKEAKKYLLNLQESKDMCFGKNKKKNYTECIDEIDDIFGVNSSSSGAYIKKYNDVCDNQILSGSTIDCAGGSIRNTLAREYLQGNKSYCKSLAETKVDIYNSVAHNILKQNKLQVTKDANKEFMQKQRTKYDNLINLININLGFMQRIVSKWQYKTSECN